MEEQEREEEEGEEQEEEEEGRKGRRRITFNTVYSKFVWVLKYAGRNILAFLSAINNFRSTKFRF